MLKRLFMLILLVIATVSASTPAHASTLSVSMQCEYQSGDPSGNPRFFFCYAFASGGSPSYTFQWYHLWNGHYSLVYEQSGTSYSEVYWLQCSGYNGTARVVVTDSAGAQVTVTRSTPCYMA